MFGEKARRIEELEQQVAELEEERESFAPFIADAQAIHAEVSNLMSHPGTPGLVAQKAFEYVLATRKDEIITSLRDEHIQANIDDLLETASDEIELAEGDVIAAEATAMVESDSTLAAAVHEKARQIAWDEALGRIAANEKRAAEEALLLEEERQIFFNRLNVQYQFDGELNLNESELLRYLKHGDKLVLDLKSKQAESRSELELIWRKESESSRGWALHAHDGGKIFFSKGEYDDGHDFIMPSQFLVEPTAITSTGGFPPLVIRDDMLLGMKINGSYYWLKSGSGNYKNLAIVTGCRLEAKEIESLTSATK